MFEVILNIAALFAVAVKLKLDVETDSVAGAAACVTVIVLVVTPLPEMVTVAVCELEVRLANAVTIIESLFEPEILLSVSQVWLLLKVHPMFEVILNKAALFAVAGKLKFDVETDSVAGAAACVTITVFDVTPLPETVTVAVRTLDEGLTDAITLIESLLEPEVLFTVNQVWLLLTFQLTLEFIPKDVALLAVAATFKVVVETVKIAGEAA
jgi:hypothetical protein